MSARAWQRRGQHAKTGRKAKQRAVHDQVLAYRAWQLTEEFPELQDRKAAQRLLDRAAAAADRLQRPDLATDPEFWRLIHLEEFARPENEKRLF